MITTNVRFFGPVGRTMDLDLPSDEPSHIHIARPSRSAARANSPASPEPTHTPTDLAAADLTEQAA